MGSLMAVYILFFNTIKKDMIEFHNTGYGRKFYEADIPRIVKALERIADALEKLDNNTGPDRRYPGI